MATVSIEIRNHIKDHAEFEEIGSGMLTQWELGMATSLKVN